MKKTVKLFIFIIILLIIAVVTIFSINLVGNAEPTIEYQPNNIYDETLVVVADKDFEPYSFYDENGNPSGHDIELIYLLADAMEMNVEIQLVEWNEAIEYTKNGQADIILGLVYTEKMTEFLQLSIPICHDTFVIFGKDDYASLNDLYDKKLATLNGSDIETVFIEQYSLENNTTKYPTYGDAFESVENGTNDYVLATYSVGRRLFSQYEDIKLCGSTLVSNAFCLGVPKDNSELIEQINEIVITKQTSGEIPDLSEKWLGKYVEVMSIGDFFKQHIMFLIVLISVILLAPLLLLIYVYRKRLTLFKNNETVILERASRDSLTNLFNRSLADSMINQTIFDTQTKTNHALFMIDIDHFKDVNDTYGHLFGDDVLIMVATEIKNVFRESDIVVRMGGDEFLVFMKNFKNRSLLENKATELCDNLNKKKLIQDINVNISISAGISIYPTDGDGFVNLYQNADKALYKAKDSGKNKFVFYDKTKFEAD